MLAYKKLTLQHVFLQIYPLATMLRGFWLDTEISYIQHSLTGVTVSIFNKDWNNTHIPYRTHLFVLSLKFTLNYHK